jgi:hypothetical protein
MEMNNDWSKAHDRKIIDGLLGQGHILLEGVPD